MYGLSLKMCMQRDGRYAAPVSWCVEASSLACWPSARCRRARPRPMPPCRPSHSRCGAAVQVQQRLLAPTNQVLGRTLAARGPAGGGRAARGGGAGGQARRGRRGGCLRRGRRADGVCQARRGLPAALWVLLGKNTASWRGVLCRWRMLSGAHGMHAPLAYIETGRSPRVRCRQGASACHRYSTCSGQRGRESSRGLASACSINTLSRKRFYMLVATLVPVCAMLVAARGVEGVFSSKFCGAGMA